MNGNLSLIEMNRLIGNKEVAESIKVFAGLFPGKIVFTTSFGMENGNHSYYFLRIISR